MSTKSKVTKSRKVTLKQARKVLEIVDSGLSRGLGHPKPGEMCVEAAVCFALGQPHGDEPECVSQAVRSFKIRLNDANWSSNEARAKGMRAIAIAQLGTRDQIDEKLFAQTLAKLTIQKIVPISIRALAERSYISPTRKAELEACALECEQTGTEASARKARSAAYAAYAAAAAADAAAADAAAAYAAYAAAAAADAAAADAAAAAYAYAANDAAKRDKVLTIAAELGVQALCIVGAAGVKLMDKLIK